MNILLVFSLTCLKAFDTVYQHILSGVNGNSIHWFESYLKNRKQYFFFRGRNKGKK